MKKTIQFIIISAILFASSCQDDVVYPDYNKYRIKIESSNVRYLNPNVVEYLEYVYEQNFKIDEVIHHYRDGGIKQIDKFEYIDNLLRKITYYRPSFSGFEKEILMKDSLVYNTDNKIQSVYTFKQNNSLETILEFNYNGNHNIEKILKDVSGIVWLKEYYKLNNENNIIQIDTYDRYSLDKELELSHKRKFRYDTWVNPNYKNGFVGSSRSWPVSVNNIIERIEIKDEVEIRVDTFYYEYLETGYPLRTNSTLASFDFYTEFEYEEVR